MIIIIHIVRSKTDQQFIKNIGIVNVRTESSKQTPKITIRFKR